MALSDSCLERLWQCRYAAHGVKPEDEVHWKRALLALRKEKDEFYQTGHNSPLPEVGRQGFRGLKYFEPNPIFRFETKLHRYQDPEGVMMTTSKGTRQLFNKVGYFELTVDGQALRLHAYQSAERDDPSIFVPFRDGTSGKESYGAARYLDLKVEHDDDYAVDFNYAYNPYCAYNERYVCPLPPTENWLRVAIPAGEKGYSD